MDDHGGEMLAFLGVPADARLLDADLANLPPAEQRREVELATPAHDRLVTAGAMLTGGTLLGGLGFALFGAWRLLFDSGGALDGALGAIGVVLAATHWGWVHVAEYAGETIDARHRGSAEERRRAWLAGIEPYPRLSVWTSVRADASTSVERVLHEPVLTGRGTFTFARHVRSERIFDADVSAETLAATVEDMRRQARLDTDRLHAQWDAAAAAYVATLGSARDDEQLRLARHAAAVVLSEHINASLGEPPLVE